MLNLTDGEYCPVLADEYQWNVYTSVEHPLLVIEVRRWGYHDPVHTSEIHIYADETPDEIRNKILEETRAIASMLRPWNREYTNMITEILNSLEPPQDAPAPEARKPRVPLMGREA